MEGLKGRIWRRITEKSALPEFEREHRIISTKLLSGHTVVHVYSEEAPAGFELVQPDLEDVYFSAMAGHYRQGVGQQKKEAQS
jgi:ABC-2 type transport system ATP-binding protein